MNYLYKITNLINNKIYIGVHRTDNINDGYMGSGKVIRSAIEKYGIENFRKDILEFFDTYENALAKEKEVVTDEFLLREDVYNLRRGGSGGFDYINKHVDMTEIRKQNGKNIPLLSRKNAGTKSSTNNQKLWKNAPELKPFNFSKEFNIEMGKRALSEIAIAKRKNTFKEIKHSQGEKNSQFGSCWINNNIENKKIKIDQLNLYIQNGWVKGRNMSL
jgi:hypothetical protein